MPSANDEYFFYQTLLGTWPFGDFDRGDYRERIKSYAVKAVREAKVHTAWIKPDHEYEETFLAFIDKVLDDPAFLAEFLPFQRRLARLGVTNSLAQALLKIAAPGIPDFYQGSEFWDFSLVDPDNRRPVDYSLRQSALHDLRRRAESGLTDLLGELLAHPEDGRIKQFLIQRALTVRRRQPEIFQQGGYLPLSAEGKYADHVFAFAREHAEGCVVAVVPRLLAPLLEEGAYPLGDDFWHDTVLQSAGRRALASGDHRRLPRRRTNPAGRSSATLPGGPADADALKSDNPSQSHAFLLIIFGARNCRCNS